jgi:hypothetical protein
LSNAIASLEQARLERCRLAPRYRLEELEDAVRFVGDRGLITLAPDSSLPSLFGAIHEPVYAPGKGGFGSYPKTRWWWGGALGASEGVVATKIHRGRLLFLSSAVARVADPLCRDALATALDGSEGSEAQRLVEHLGAAGSSAVDEVKAELGLSADALRRVRARLERTGAIVGTATRLETGGGHVHTSLLCRWDQVVREARSATPQEALLGLVSAGVSAAVLAPEAELAAWFSLRPPPDAVSTLVEQGSIVRVGTWVADAHALR